MTDAERLWDARERARGVVRGMLRGQPDDVEDVLQDACVRAWERRRSFWGEAKYTTWFTSIAVRSALMHLRRRPVRAPATSLEAGGDELISPAASPEALAMRRERCRRLHAAIARLTPTQRLGALSLLREESPANGTEKSWRFRMKRRLKILLEEDQ